MSPNIAQIKDWRRRRPRNPLFEYASRYWADHLVEEQCDSELKELIISLVANENWTNSMVLYNEYKECFHWATDDDPICEPDNWLSDLHSHRCNRVHFLVELGLSFLLEPEKLARLGIRPEQLDFKDDEGRTPLAWAVYRKREAAVKMLVHNKSVDINLKNHNLETPLWCSVFFGCPAIANILLNCEGIDVDAPNINGVSPLARAVLNWDMQLVASLLKRKDVDVNRRDTFGTSILGLAAEHGDLSAVELLLQRPDIRVESIDKEGGSLLTWAAEGHFYGIVERLLKRGEVDVNRRYNSGRTPLSQAIASGDRVMAEMLLGHSDINPVLEDGTDLRTTPLMRVIENNREEPVRLPLGRENV